MASLRRRFTFLNPHQRRVYRSFFHFLLWKLGAFNDSRLIAPMPENFTFPNACEPYDINLPNVAWVNHSSFLIQVGKKNLITDPIWSERCSPFSFLGPKRRHRAIPEIEHLPAIDYVIISHNHYDHLDKKSLLILHERHPEITWIIPRGVKKWFMRNIPHIEKQRVIELDWWESFTDDEWTFHAVPAQHFSGRGLLDKNNALWMGCVVQVQHKRFYFAGDTGYNPIDFKEIGRHFAPLDLSLLPIGVYLPRRFMQAVHVNPDESIQIHRDVHSKLSIGGHWKTFCLSDEPLNRPPYDLFQALERANVSCEEFRVLNPGQRINW